MKKIKNLTLGILGATILSLGLYACSNDNETTTTSNAAKEQNVMAAKSVFNYEIYGTTHNEYLDYVSAHPDFHNFTFEQSFNYGQTFKNEHIDFSKVNVSSNEMKVAINQIKEALSSESGEINYLLSKGLINDEEVELATELFQIFDNAVDVEKETFKSVDEFKNDVLAFENKIKENYPIIFEEDNVSIGAKYLITSSVAKNSYTYWVKAALNPNSAYHNYLGDNFILGNQSMNSTYGKKGGIFKKIWDGIRIGVADVAGFLGNVCEPNHNNPNECVITIPSIDRAIDIAGDVSDSIGRS